MRLRFCLPIVVAALSLVGSAAAQSCDCGKELKFLETQVKRNLIAYDLDVIRNKSRDEYGHHEEMCDKMAAEVRDTIECLHVLARYISFFRDEHFFMNYKEGYRPFKSLEDTPTVRAYYSAMATYPLDSPVSRKKGIQGVWRSTDGVSTVYIAPYESVTSDYRALVLRDNDLFWRRGQQRFLLQQDKKKRRYTCYLMSGTRRPRVERTELDGDTLKVGRKMTYYRLREEPVTEAATKMETPAEMSFRELSAKTNYLCIPDFDYNLYSKIDSLVKSNIASITSKPNLIIDVRYNGGGGDRSYQELLPLVFDKKKIRSPMAAAVYCTPDNIGYYTASKYKNSVTREDSLWEDTLIAVLNENKGRYTPSEFDTIEVDTTYAYPQKVVILMNRKCASSAEGFILTARQSGKVLLAGENTWGVMSYGDWRELPMPCLPIKFTLPTKRMFFAMGNNYETIGIAPDLPLDTNQGGQWVEQARKVLEEQ